MLKLHLILGSIQYDFGSGVENAIEFNQSQFDNLSVKLPSHYEGMQLYKLLQNQLMDHLKLFQRSRCCRKSFPAIDDISITVEILLLE